MKQLLSILIIIILLPSMSVECEDPMAEEPPYELPPITQEGANAFGCLINGEVWIPGSSDSKIKTIDARYPLADIFDIYVTNTFDNTDYFNLRLKDTSNIWEGHTYRLYTKEDATFAFELDDCLFVNGYQGGQIVAGELFVSKYNIRPEFISGTFWFTAVSDCDTVFVTEGRFDLPFTR